MILRSPAATVNDAYERRITYWRGRAKAAQRRLADEVEMHESTIRWAQGLSERERHLADRCTFLYEQAITHGATREDLIGEAP